MASNTGARGAGFGNVKDQVQGKTMLKSTRWPLALALALTPFAATAAPATSSTAVALPPAAVVTPVQFRRGGFGGGLGIGLGIGVLGAVIANEAYRPRPGVYYDDDAYEGPYYAPAGYAGDPRGLCAEHFRSFEWNTGLYTAYSGEKRLCPYLR